MISGNTLRNTAIILLGVAILAVGAWLWTSRQANDQAGRSSQLWTCSMHPQIRLDHPGKCPICGMELIPVATAAATKVADSSPHAGTHLTLDEHARQMARVETAEIGLRGLTKEVIAAGKVQFDESTQAQITARIDGRVDEVQANFPGTLVKEGDHLVSIYSPELFATQNELLNSLQRGKSTGDAFSGDLTASARRRLELWGITPQQIDELIKSGQASTHLTVFAPRAGTIVQKNVQAGQYVRVGDVLYSIADLSHVWLIVNVYESELPWVRFGQPVEIRLEGAAGEPLRGAIGFIEPVLDEASRTVRVRVILPNPGGLLKPGMYAQAIIRIPITADGTPAPTGLEGKYICPMHPYIVSDRPGKCSVCQMPLELVPGKPRDAATEPPQVLAVPASAVLSTGRRQLVYVETEAGTYHVAEPKLGPRAGDYYPVLDGLKPGYRVVVRGNFLLDSQFQITGNPSLLYPEGIAGGGAGHGGHSLPPATTSTSPVGSSPHGAHSGDGGPAPVKPN